MLFEEELAILDYNTSIHLAEEKGQQKLSDLIIWLYNNGRDDDVKKAAEDPTYRKKLFEEYSKIKK